MHKYIDFIKLTAYPPFINTKFNAIKHSTLHFESVCMQTIGTVHVQCVPYSKYVIQLFILTENSCRFTTAMLLFIVHNKRHGCLPESGENSVRVYLPFE